MISGRFYSFFLFVFCVAAFLSAAAQKTEVFDRNVHTVELRVNDHTAGAVPVIRLHGNDRLHISFDELSHDVHRYIYTVEHVDGDYGKEEGLLESDYLSSAMGEGIIDDFAQSMNTSVLYTHYRFSLPNADMRPLLSGNYSLTVYDDTEGDRTPVFRTFFYVNEDNVSLLGSATTDTDIERNGRLQQLSVRASWKELPVNDARGELRLVVWKNGDFSTRVQAGPTTSSRAGEALWEHSRPLIFPAGNEYRKFEIQSTHYPGMHTESVRYYDPYYHLTVSPDEPCRNYIYDEDQNGVRRIVAAGGGDAEIEAEYMWMHFTLFSEKLPENVNLYVDGRWTSSLPHQDCVMKYDEEIGAYICSLFLKGGYYSYRYLTEGAEEALWQAYPDGNFWQTENEYTMMVYFKARGARYERLVGCRTASFRPK